MMQSLNTVPRFVPPSNVESHSPEQIRQRYAELSAQNTLGKLAQIKEQILAVGSKPLLCVNALFNAFSEIPSVKFLLEQDCRIPEKYSIREHESMYVAQREKYMRDFSRSLPLSETQLRIVGVLHDIGKPLPDNKADQHRATLEVIRELKAALPFDQNTLRIACSLIGNDPLGRFVVKNFQHSASIDQRREISEIGKGRNLEYLELKAFAELVVLRPMDAAIRNEALDIAKEFRLRSAALGLTPQELYGLHRLSHSSDVSAYTYDAVAYNSRRGNPGIEFMFRLNPEFDVIRGNNLFFTDSETGLIELAPPIKELFGLIEDAL